MSERYRSIARVEKAHGRHGEVVVVPTHGLPFLLSVGMQVALVPPALFDQRRYTITRLSNSNTGQLVSFDGIDSLDAATALVGRSVLARQRDLPDNFEMLNLDELIGRSVRDVRFGPLGLIDEVMLTPAHAVWVVRSKNKSVMIPAHEDFIVSMDNNLDIVVSLPDGLIEESSL